MMKSCAYKLKRIFILVFLASFVFLSGCAKLAHIQELLAIKSFSDNQDMQDKYVWDNDERFDKLLAVIKDGTLSSYTSQKSITKAFGWPIYYKEIEEDGRILEKWVYRYAARSSGSDKVYIYFDKEANLVRFKHIKPKKT